MPTNTSTQDILAGARAIREKFADHPGRYSDEMARNITQPAPVVPLKAGAYPGYKGAPRI